MIKTGIFFNYVIGGGMFLRKVDKRVRTELHADANPHYGNASTNRMPSAEGLQQTERLHTSVAAKKMGDFPWIRQKPIVV